MTYQLDMALVIWSMVIIALFTLLWTVSSFAKYWIKFGIFVLVSICAASLPIPLMLLRPRDPRNALMPAAILRASCKILGLELHVEGEENIIQNSGSVVLINHQSMLDLIVLACLWPRIENATVISKKEIFYVQPFGLAAWLWGTIFISRGTKDAQESVKETGQIISKRKARVFMFPEGTRNLGTNKLLPFKKGGFHLALASNVPIQPVAVCRYKFLKKFVFDNGSIKIRILPCISTEGYDKENMSELIDQTYKVMSENVENLSREDNLKCD